MGLMEQAIDPDNNIHTRKISLATYPAKNNGIIVEGTLKDDRSVGVYVATGEKKPPGTIHHMLVRLLIGKPGLTIQDVEVEMITYPRDECFETRESLERLKGLQIQSGFTANVKELIGGNKGCAHLTTLVNSMAQEAVQGFYTFIAKNAEGSKAKKNKTGFSSFITDTCYVWRKDGPVLKKLMAEYDKDNKKF